jgi:hypothetical protein
MSAFRGYFGSSADADKPLEYPRRHVVTSMSDGQSLKLADFLWNACVSLPSLSQITRSPRRTAGSHGRIEMRDISEFLSAITEFEDHFTGHGNDFVQLLEDFQRIMKSADDLQNNATIVGRLNTIGLSPDCLKKSMTCFIHDQVA